MLALTDESLARLVIGATAVPRRSRGQWLRRFAREVASDHRRKVGAARQQRARQRQRDVQRIYQLVITDAAMEAVIDALVSYGRLSEADTLRPEAVASAFADIVVDLGRRFRAGSNAP